MNYIIVTPLVESIQADSNSCIYVNYINDIM